MKSNMCLITVEFFFSPKSLCPPYPAQKRKQRKEHLAGRRRPLRLLKQRRQIEPRKNQKRARRPHEEGSQPPNQKNQQNKKKEQRTDE